MIPQIILSGKDNAGDEINIYIDSEDGYLYEISIVNENTKEIRSGYFNYQALINQLLQLTNIIGEINNELL